MINTKQTTNHHAKNTKAKFAHHDIGELDNILIGLYHLAGSDSVSSDEATQGLDRLAELTETLDQCLLKIKDMKDWAKGCFYLLETRQQHPSRGALNIVANDAS